MTVIRQTKWTRKFGGLSDGNAPGCLDGKVTHIRVYLAGAGMVDAYVRENFRCDTFTELSSGSRLGALRSGMPDHQVLELATDGDWFTIAGVVAAADARKRRVIRNRAWTVRAATILFGRRASQVEAVSA